MTIVRVPNSLATDRDVYRALLRSEPCAYCPERHAGTIDHVQPLSAGGENVAALNIVGSCAPCNQAKQSTPLLLWLLERLTAE